jgi:hypothetical protein
MEVVRMKRLSGSLKRATFGITLLSVLSWFAISCGSNPINPMPPAPGPLSGNWQMTLQPSNPSFLTKTQSGFLVEDGSNLTGSMMFTDINCTGVGNLTGTVNGGAITMTVTPTGLEVNLSGTVASTPTSMSGSYTILATGCTGSEASPQTGSWTANPVSALNGNYSGSFTSNKAAATLAVTGQITQGSNVGGSNASLSGSLSATGYCFTTANMTGAISGTSVVMNLVNSSGAQIGQISGTSSLDGTSISGTYRIVVLGNGFPPCQSGDNGTFTLSQSQ